MASFGCCSATTVATIWQKSIPDSYDVPGGSGSVEDARQALVGKLGENIQVRRFSRFQMGE